MSDPTIPGPRNVLGRRQLYSFGNPLKHDPRPMQIREIVEQKNQAQRALRALTGGVAQLEYAAEVCGTMNMQRPEEAVRYVRHRELGHHYDDLPLCRLEKLIIKRTNAMMVLACYAMIAPAVREQLDGLRRA